MKSRRAHTLLELLIASTLFLLALAVCGQLAITGVRSRQQGMERNHDFRQIITVFHQLEREVRSCQALYLPDLSDLNPVQPGLTAPPLVVVVHDPEGQPQVMAWSWREDQLLRTQYRPDFDPGLLASQIPLAQTRQLKSPGVQAFRVQLEAPGPNFGARLVRLEVQCAPPLQHQLVTTIGILP